MTSLNRVLTCTAGLLMASIVAGCATAPQSTENASTDAPDGTRQNYQQRVAQLVEQNPLFALLTAEIASQRGDAYSATLAYTEAAKLEKDPELAKRALEIALGESQLEAALDAARLWQQLAPTDKQASRSVLVLQLGTNRVDEAMPALKAYLDEVKGAEQAHPGLSGATPHKVALEMLLRIPDKTKAYNTAIALFGNDPKDADTQLLLSQIAESSDQFALAADHLTQVIAVSPQERYYVQLAQIMERRDASPDAALKLIEAKVDENPRWFGARLYLARTYTQLEQWPQARDRFREMIALQPDNTPLYSSLGFVLSKTGDRQGAEANFNTYLKRTPAAERQNETLIYLTLAEMALGEKDISGALRWLDKAPNAQNDFDIQLKKSAVYEQQGNYRAAAKVLNAFKPANEDLAVRLTLAKSQLAESRKMPEQAVAELENSLKTYPNQPDLLYERAMVAERQNDLNTVETYLNALIKVRPDNPHGYNALGYTLAERNVRLPEALKLISKAVELAPNDPFILDSLGWVHYRMGNLDKAVETLRKAYALRPDEEIGAHLIEVLSKNGEQDEARKLGDSLKQRFPNSDKLGRLLQTLSGV
ncbi:MAG TPA: tetratricopeptide repeat protein [Limnobacter sp.]|uniref:tetratricopeptide repeat protein n=1 Tax=Limnobacter sp. TaxID=2003368 RepID=UPI002EDB4857